MLEKNQIHFIRRDKIHFIRRDKGRHHWFESNTILLVAGVRIELTTSGL